ncbi:MAG: TonB-dependent receptor plug domain-containing protein [Breznakibacter sp.]
MIRIPVKMLISVLMGVMLAMATVRAQETKPPVNVDGLTLEQMKGFTGDDLLQIPFEDLIKLVKKFKLSSIDELYNLLLNPTQTTASKKAEDLFSAPLATSVITAQELERSGARSIPEALRLAPGIIVREKTNGDYDVHIRGNDFVPPGSDLSNSVNSSTLVMVNNRPVYNAFVGAAFWENLPVEIGDIEKIEVIYGPAAALYGPNAVSGVIHIITKDDAKEGWSATVNVQTGTKNSQIAYGAVTYSNKKWLVGLSGNYQRMDRFQKTYYIPQRDEYVEGKYVGDIISDTDTTFNANAVDEDYAKAKEKAAINLFAVYQPNGKVRIGYDGAIQASSVQTAYMDIGSVLSTRESNTFSNNFSLRIGNFDANMSAVGGHLNAIKGMAGYEYDFAEMNGKIGYDFKYKNLSFRPGVDANYAYYSDGDYVDASTDGGLLNGSARLGTVQGSLRLDYTALGKLRLVGAWMQGYFYKPGRSYAAYQFASTYRPDDRTLFRLVASKSNSSPFVLNTYMNKQISTQSGGLSENGQQPTQSTFIRLGNDNLDPLEMHMVEIGLRHLFFKNLQFDVSVFYSRTKNYAEWQNETRNDDAGEGAEPAEGGQTVQIITETIRNLDTESHQYGITAKLDYVVNQKLNLSVFGTMQKTYLKNFEVSDSSYFTGLTGGSIDRQTLESNPVNLSLEHTYTPAFYGGGTLNYQPAPKWNIHSSVYMYGRQKTFYEVMGTFKWLQINPKAIANLKVSYDVNRWIQVYVNARNIVDDRSKEFVFTDDIGGSYLAGIKLSF